MLNGKHRTQSLLIIVEQYHFERIPILFNPKSYLSYLQVFVIMKRRIDFFRRCGMICPKCKKDDHRNMEMCPACGAPIKPIPIPPNGKIRFGEYVWYVLEK